MHVVLFGGLERTPTFLVPIINPPFADTARTPSPGTPPAPSKSFSIKIWPDAESRKGPEPTRISLTHAFLNATVCAFHHP